MDVKKAKADLRDAITDRLRRMKPNEHAAESRSLCRRILGALPPAPVTICAFSSLNDEPDIFPLLTELLKRGDHVFLPAHEGNKLAFRQITDMKELTPGKFGILEPSLEGSKPENIDIALIPGRAYDRQGNRLGRGNGGYDIWLRYARKEHPGMQAWGVILECQLVHDIPMEPHDERVDTVVTARGLMACR